MLFAFLHLRFSAFAFSLLRFCYHAPTKTISLQVGRKLADKTKDEIMTEVLRVFAGLDVKTVQVAYEVVRVIFASPDFPPLASSSQSAEASVSRDSSDSQLLKDNELDLLQSQSILQDLVPLSGDSSDAESNQRASKTVGKTTAPAKRSNLLQALLSIFVLQAAKSLTLLLPILLNWMEIMKVIVVLKGQIKSMILIVSVGRLPA